MKNAGRTRRAPRVSRLVHPTHLRLLVRGALLRTGSGLDPLLEVVLREVSDGDPGEAHLVNGPRTAADPVFRIRIPPVVGRVVVPAGDVDDGARREKGRHVVAIRIRDVPSELIVADTTQSLDPRRTRPCRVGANIRVDRF